MKHLDCRERFHAAYNYHKSSQLWGAILITPVMTLLAMWVSWFKFGDKYGFYLPVLLILGGLAYSTYHIGFKVMGEILTRTAQSLEISDDLSTIIVHTWPWFKQPTRSITLNSTNLRHRKRITDTFLRLRDQPAFAIPTDGLEVIIHKTAFDHQINLEALFQEIADQQPSQASGK